MKNKHGIRTNRRVPHSMFDEWGFENFNPSKPFRWNIHDVAVVALRELCDDLKTYWLWPGKISLVAFDEGDLPHSHLKIDFDLLQNLKRDAWSENPEHALAWAAKFRAAATYLEREANKSDTET